MVENDLFTIIQLMNILQYIVFFVTELRTSLDEHQSALELIMTKYREQVLRLLVASKRDDPAIVTQLKEQHTTVSALVSLVLSHVQAVPS